MLLIVVIAVVTGPFHTLSQLSLPERILYWGLCVLSAFLAAQIVTRTLAPFLEGAQSWKVVISQTLAMGFFYAPFIYGWTVVMVPPVGGDAIAFGRFVRDVLLISLAVFITLQIVIYRQDTQVRREVDAASAKPAPILPPEPVASSDNAEEARPRFMRRIDAEDPGPVLRLEALDHFVTAVTPEAQYHLRMRLIDAIDEMDGVEGMMIHRSHWVTQRAVIGPEFENRRLFLRVACGARIPVSRKYMPEVQQKLLN